MDRMADDHDAMPRVRAWDVRVREGEAERFMQDQVAVAKGLGIDILVLRGELVFGTDHLEAGVLHARRAADEGRNASDSPAMEALLYISGERQLSSAIKKMGVGPSTTHLVVAQLSPGAFPAKEGWMPLPRMRPDADPGDLLAFGVTPAETATVPEGRSAELVLEKVASVDITKR
jgi:tRNA threonylcarbamoyladenosine modification (KEOPS) complex Cgi121 subunit